MIRTPHEPDDRLLRLPLGAPVNRPPAAVETKPFTNWQPVKDRLGWEHDGCGHKRFDGLPDALRNEKAENAKLAEPEQALIPPLSFEQAAGKVPKRWLSSGVPSPKVPTLAAEVERLSPTCPPPSTEQHLKPRVDQGTGLAMFEMFEMDARGVFRPLSAPKAHDQVLPESHELLNHAAPKIQLRHKPKPYRLAISLVNHTHHRCDDGTLVHTYAMSNRTCVMSTPLEGTTLGLCNGVDPGDEVGPLVDWDHSRFDGRRLELRSFLQSLLRELPQSVPLYHRCSLNGQIKRYQPRE